MTLAPPPDPNIAVIVASWYGDAEMGGPIACGTGNLNGWALGVASRTLPCGTVIRICTLGAAQKCIEAPVVDRGPYVTGRDLDMTFGTVRRLHLRLETGLYRLWYAKTGRCYLPRWAGAAYPGGCTR